MWYSTFLCDILDEAPQHTFESIRKLKSRLSDLVETDFGLLDELLYHGVLTHRQYDDIRSGGNTASELLDLLTSDEQCDKFVQALQRTAQQHVVNFVSQNGG